VAAQRCGQGDDSFDAGLAEFGDRVLGEPVGGVLDSPALRLTGFREPARLVEQAARDQALRRVVPFVVAPATGPLQPLATDRAGGDVSKCCIEAA